MRTSVLSYLLQSLGIIIFVYYEFIDDTLQILYILKQNPIQLITNIDFQREGYEYHKIGFSITV